MRIKVFKGVISLAAALLCAFGLWHSSHASNQDAPTGATSAETAESKRASVKALFDQRCARCHGQDGRGQTRLGEMLDAPDFTKKEWWREDISDKRLKTSIADGKGEMPSFGKKLSKSEISALAAYVREFGKDTR